MRRDRRGDRSTARAHARRRVGARAGAGALVLATVAAGLGVCSRAAAPAAAVVPGENGLIAFQSDRDGDWEIYTADADGSGQTALTDNGARDIVPTWSPDGTRIAFASDRDGNYEVYVMNADGSGQTRLTDNIASDSLPSWSPDGTRLAFNTNRDGHQQIYVMNADGSGQADVSNSLVTDIQPAWSPDGATIAFTRADDVWTMDADGGNQIRLTTDLALDGLAGWSPDSGTIAFANNTNGGGAAHFDVYLMTRGGSPLGNLTGTSGYTETRPSWSPDGTRIAYAGSPSATGPYDIWVMGANGSDPVKVVESPGSDYWPDWQSSPTRGSITIVQDSRPDSAQDFHWAVTGPGVSSFDLDDDPNGALPSSITFDDLESTTYTFTQAAVTGWSLTSLGCDAGGTVNLGQRRVSVALGHGQNVTCTFVDAKRRPDAMVATASGGPWFADNAYATSVTPGQTRTASVARGATRTFYVRLQNDGGATDSLRVKGVTSGSAGYTVKYKLGTENVTSAVVAGTWTTVPLAPGASVVLKVKVTATTAAVAGSARNVDLTVRSVAATTVKDVVRARATRS